MIICPLMFGLSSNFKGTMVVFPAPGGATITARFPNVMASCTCVITSCIGSKSLKVYLRTNLARPRFVVISKATTL